MVAIFVLMMALSAGRPLGINLPAGDDFVSWCMAAMAFLGLAHTFRSGEMIRVGLLIDGLEGRTRHVIEIAALIIGTAFVGFFAWHAVVMNYDSWRFHDMSQGVIAVPLWIPQLGYSGGLVILLVAFVDELVHVLRGQCAALRAAEAQDRRGGGRAGDPERGLRTDDAGRNCADPVRVPRRAAGGRAVDRARAAGHRLGRDAVRRRQHPGRQRARHRRSGATAPPGRWRRCRCSSGWARSCSARGSRRRCSAASRRGSTGCRAG